MSIASTCSRVTMRSASRQSRVFILGVVLLMITLQIKQLIYIMNEPEPLFVAKGMEKEDDMRQEQNTEKKKEEEEIKQEQNESKNVVVQKPKRSWLDEWRRGIHGDDYDFDDRPWSNLTTIAWSTKRFYAGYRNQVMALTILVIMAVKANHSQILHPMLEHKDLYGSNLYISFADLFDVKHWNSHYPQLPRMVACDSEIHTDIDCSTLQFKSHNTTKPYQNNIGMAQLFGGYMRYASRKGPHATPTFPHPIDLVMLKSAVRPNPYLLKVVRNFIKSLGDSSHNQKGNHLSTTTTKTTNDDDDLPVFMTLHARVEPDKIHDKNGCGHKQETNLSKIFEFVETKFPQPPAKHLYLLANLPLLFQAGEENIKNEKNESSIDWISVENAKTARRALKDGLWNGTVDVFSFGQDILIGTPYEERRSTSGAVLAFHLAKMSNIFIGTEMSSFSVDLVTTRFYSGNHQNYNYLPQGIQRWTNDADKYPPSFAC